VGLKPEDEVTAVLRNTGNTRPTTGRNITKDLNLYVLRLKYFQHLHKFLIYKIMYEV
jgi:hypothetical protein